MKLVIVESPAKAKTINKYLGKDFKVIASFGHIRDLPSKNGSVLPDQGFAMKYEFSEKSKKYIDEIAKSAKQASEIYLATDPDREGESISWHVIEMLKEKKIVKNNDLFKRIAFNEITKKSVLHAVANPRKVDDNLVNAQQARRALDYLVGFTLSPVLWRKLPGCRSAGRVQSVALRLISEREDEIEKFITQEYWDITLNLANRTGDKFSAKLTHINKEKLDKFAIKTQAAAQEIVKKLEPQEFSITSIEKKQQRRTPPPPFITSSMQQEASRKLGFSAKKTMQVAQKLYEGISIDGDVVGLITYMRTDGVTLSSDAVADIRTLINKKFGNKYLPKAARMYKSKSKNAQEAHEAIRPTNIKFIPDDIKSNLDKDQFKLYDLIWKRTMACQMESVIIDMVVANLDSKNQEFSAKANGSTITFDGFYKIYKEGADDSEEEKNKLLPPLAKGEEVATQKIIPEQHFTQPPPRYSEASLVKQLEDLGIGRPSTYASILSVLQDRKYATIEKKRFHPSELGRLLTVFLVKYFTRYVEYGFTADMETDLDKIAEGEIPWKKLLTDFWQGFNKEISTVSEYKTGDVIAYVEEALEFHLFGEKDSEEYKKNKKCGSCSNGELGLKLGKYGAFLACSNYPDCEFRKQIVKNDSSNTAEVSNNSHDNRELGYDENGDTVYLKKGPYGFYIQRGEQKTKGEKPQRSPLPSSIKPNDLDIKTALNLLKLPMIIGNPPETEEEIAVGIGKFGPYIREGKKFTSVPKNINIFNIDLPQALEIIAQKNKKKKKE